ncbi:MAG: 50S ribosomal protein L19 [bacterium]|nr:50S ribosomal protein L19 [bacterium]
MNIVDSIRNQQVNDDIPEFSVGDTLRFRVRVVEGAKERFQTFQGSVIQRKGSGIEETFTIRKVSGNVGVERVFPVNSPNLSNITIVSRGKVRRAKLYYLRKLSGKKARIASRRDFTPKK